MKDFELTLNNLLVDTFNYILKYEEKSLRAITSAPVTITEAHIIEAIGKCSEGSTVGEIASMLGVTMPTATVALKKLESKGLVKKTPSADDGRRSIVTLTDSGKKINKAHHIFHIRMVKNISNSFRDDEKEVLLSAVKKLDQFFKDKVEKSGN